MDPDDYDKEYATDEVSLTSTVESVTEGDYIYEYVVAESTVTLEDGTEEDRWLIKWYNYPMHRSTWEPIQHLEPTNLLVDWATKREGLGEKKFQKFNESQIRMYDETKEKATAAKERRHERRVKRRKKINEAQSNVAPDAESDSDDDLPILPRGRAMRKTVSATTERTNKRATRTTSPAKKKKSVPKQLTLEQTSSSEEGSSEEDSDASQDSLFNELNAQRKEPGWGGSSQQDEEQPKQGGRVLRKGSDKQKSQASYGTAPPRRRLSRRRTSLTEQSEALFEEQGTKSPNLTKPVAKTSSKGPSTMEAIPLSESSKPTAAASVDSAQAASSSAPTASIKRTGSGTTSSNPIRLVNQPKSLSRKQWHNSEKLYSTLHYRATAEKRSRAEGTPDPNVLEFVNAPSQGLPENTMGSRRPSVDDNPYGRRETRRRRLQVIDADEPSHDTPKNSDGLQSYETGKIPLTCFDWKNGHCSYTAETCRFLHRINDPSGRPYPSAPWDGKVPPKYSKPPVTCFYWLRGHKGCEKSADGCHYAHRNTGWLASKEGRLPEQIDPNEPPRVGKAKSTTLPKHHQSPVTCWYWLRSTRGCAKPAEGCIYAHENTGLLGNREGGAPERIDQNELPITGEASHRPSFPVLPVHPKTPEAPIPTGPSRTRTSSFKKWLPPSQITCFFWSEGICHQQPLEDQEEAQSTLAAPDRLASHSPIDVPIPDETVRSFAATSLEDYPPKTSSSPSPYRELSQAAPTTLNVKQNIEEACRLNFADMFVFNGDGGGDAILDRRAFLLFHPEDHVEEVDLITRWLLIHHVETYSLWFDGAWDHFKQKIIDGGTGIIIAHPDFEHYADVSGFADVLRSKVRLWSVGVQEAYDYDPQISTFPATYEYDRIEIFPHGGIIYITDDVFKKKPQEALKIFELFCAKIEKCRQVAGPIDPWKHVDDGCLLWRLAVRPELMQALYEKCDKSEAEITAEDPDHVSRVKLYELLSQNGYIEQDDAGPFAGRPDDYFPIISERYQVMKYYYYPALKQSQELANTRMIEYFAGLTIEHRRDYRQFFVVHTLPESTAAVDWKERIQNIDEIVTPEKCIEYFEQPAKGNRFDFYEWAFPAKGRVDSVAA